MNRDEKLHAEWLSLVQQDGLLVSAMTLAEKEIYIRQPIEKQQAFREKTEEAGLASFEDLRVLLEWPRGGLREPKEEEILHFPDLFATIKPTFILQSLKREPMIAVFWCEEGLDESPKDQKWVATHQVRVERYLNQQAPHIGLHANSTTIRLCYAPPGESPATLDFPVDFMCMADGRILIDALHMLLNRTRVYTRVPEQSLQTIITESRANQEKVTETLAGQVEDALRIVIAGFDRANARSGKTLLRDVEVTALYDALTSVLLRMVFILYAEDKGLLPMDNVLYNEAYSLGGLGQQLEKDYVFHSASMDRRYGAWGRLCALFRLIYLGCSHPELYMPPRQGDLFDPGLHGFLEGRTVGSFHPDEVQKLPEIDDLCVHEILQKLRYLKGQMLSYRNLEVEQIGSVYEALMGLQIERADGPAVALTKDMVVVSLHDLREANSPTKFLVAALGKKKDADIHKLFPGSVPKKGEKDKEEASIPSIKAWKAGDDIDGDLKTLEAVLKPQMRGDLIPSGSHYLQGSPGRRWSGSHYTPRSLSEPIVRKTIDPVLGENPTPKDILSLKVCDPAMGSAAFLAEACRYLGERLVEAWARTDSYPEQGQKQEDWALVARRMIAERCLYGVDKNPRAVQLARLSMWIVTSAKDLPFTFLDHNLKYGDAVVGCTKKQIATFDWQGIQKKQLSLPLVNRSTQESIKHRLTITADQLELSFGDPIHAYKQRRGRLEDAEEAVRRERTIGDLLVACVWAGGTKGDVKKRITRMQTEMEHWYVDTERELSEEAKGLLVGLYGGKFGFKPFHWELEFPEVFEKTKERPLSGFDAVVGNPPFMGKNTCIASNGDEYLKILAEHWIHAHGKSDLCSYFFLQVEEVLRVDGCFGLIATNTIDQGVTRETGLQKLTKDKTIEFYDVTLDQTWPVSGAAVIVSIIHGVKGKWIGKKFIDGTKADWINSELEALEELPSPVVLRTNEDLSHIGSIIYGSGFLLEEEEIVNLSKKDSKNKSLIFPYLGGQEFNSSPTLSHRRYVINFGEMLLSEAETYVDLISIVKERVKPERDASKGLDYKKWWWQFGRKQLSLYKAIAGFKKCLVCTRVSKYSMFGFKETSLVFADSTVVFALDQFQHFAILQSQVHSPWARKMGSSMKNDPRYTPSSCFQTFPFPPSAPETDTLMESTGKSLYEARSAYMVKHQVGMTETWNRLLEENNEHYETAEIEDIRKKRYAMDKAVLKAYGWDDLEPTDDKEIIARLRKLNAERALEEVLAEEPALDAMVKEASAHIKKLGKPKDDNFELTSDTKLTDLLALAGKKLKKVKTEVTKAKKLIKPFKAEGAMVDATSKKNIHNATKKIRALVDEILGLSLDKGESK